MLLTFLKKLLRLAVFLSQPFFFLLKLSFKLNIKLVYFITTNLFFYCFYLFCFIFTYFSHNQPNYYRIFSACFCCYIFAHSFELYLLCNINFTLVWLESFLEDDFLLKHLGGKLYAKPFVMLLIGMVLIFGINFISLYISQWQNQIQLEHLAKHSKLLFGPKFLWTPEQILNYLKIDDLMFSSNTLDIITKVMTYLSK